MEKSLDIALRQQMNIDEMPNLGDIPVLGERAKKLIAARKKETVSSTRSQPALSILDLIFGKYKMISLSFCLIGIISAHLSGPFQATFEDEIKRKALVNLLSKGSAFTVSKI